MFNNQQQLFDGIDWPSCNYDNEQLHNHLIDIGNRMITNLPHKYGDTSRPPSDNIKWVKGYVSNGKFIGGVTLNSISDYIYTIEYSVLIMRDNTIEYFYNVYNDNNKIWYSPTGHVTLDKIKGCLLGHSIKDIANFIFDWVSNDKVIEYYNNGLGKRDIATILYHRGLPANCSYLYNYDRRTTYDYNSSDRIFSLNKRANTVFNTKNASRIYDKLFSIFSWDKVDSYNPDLYHTIIKYLHSITDHIHNGDLQQYDMQLAYKLTDMVVDLFNSNHVDISVDTDRAVSRIDNMFDCIRESLIIHRDIDTMIEDIKAQGIVNFNGLMNEYITKANELIAEVEYREDAIKMLKDIVRDNDGLSYELRAIDSKLEQLNKREYEYDNLPDNIDSYYNITDRLMIEMPDNSLDLVEWGDELHNCLANWTTSHNHECYIFSIIHDKLGLCGAIVLKPYDNGYAITQFKGHCNSYFYNEYLELYDQIIQYFNDNFNIKWVDSKDIKDKDKYV